MFDFTRWQQLWKRLGSRVKLTVQFEQLQAAYSEPHRFYHNAVHILDCLQQFDSVRHLATRADEVELAIWYHDIVYNPRASDNEERSAAWAKRDLENANINSEKVGRIVDLIMATKHDSEPATTDAELMVD